MRTGTSGKFYIEIDALFDTWLGTAVKLYQTDDHDIERKLLENGYLGRSHNVLESLVYSIDHSDMLKSFENRDAGTLRRSKTTNLLNLLKGHTYSPTADPSHPQYVEALVYVDFYPYRNLSDPITNAILENLRLILNCPVIAVNIGIEKLTMTEIRDRDYGTVIIRSLHEWHKSHLYTMRDTPMPNVTMLAPYMYKDEYHTKDFDPKIETMLVQSHAPYLHLSMFPLADFSACPPMEI